MYWLLYVGGMLIVLEVLARMYFRWKTETASLAGLYHLNAAKDGEILCFPPLNIAKTIQPGDIIYLYTDGVTEATVGAFVGETEQFNDITMLRLTWHGPQKWDGLI